MPGFRRLLDELGTGIDLLLKQLEELNEIAGALARVLSFGRRVAAFGRGFSLSLLIRGRLLLCACRTRTGSLDCPVVQRFS